MEDEYITPVNSPTNTYDKENVSPVGISYTHMFQGYCYVREKDWMSWTDTQRNWYLKGISMIETPHYVLRADGTRYLLTEEEC